MGIGVNLRWLRALDQHLSANGVSGSRTSAAFQKRVYEAFLECDVVSAGAPVLPLRGALDEMHGKVRCDAFGLAPCNESLIYCFRML